MTSKNYHLRTAENGQYTPSRRQFLRIGGVGLLGLALGCSSDPENDVLAPESSHYPVQVRQAPSEQVQDAILMEAYWQPGMSADDVRKSLIPAGGIPRFVEILGGPEYGEKFYTSVVGGEAENLQVTITDLNTVFFDSEGKEFFRTSGNERYFVDSQGLLRDREKPLSTGDLEGGLRDEIWGRIKRDTPRINPSAPPGEIPFGYAKLQDGLYEIVANSPDETLYNHRIRFRVVNGQARPFLMLRRGLMNIPDNIDQETAAKYRTPFIDEHDLNRWNSDVLKTVLRFIGNIHRGSYTRNLPAGVDPGSGLLDRLVADGAISESDKKAYLVGLDHVISEVNKVGFPFLQVGSDPTLTRIEYDPNGSDNVSFGLELLPEDDPFLREGERRTSLVTKINLRPSMNVSGFGRERVEGPETVTLFSNGKKYVLPGVAIDTVLHEFTHAVGILGDFFSIADVNPDFAGDDRSDLTAFFPAKFLNDKHAYLNTLSYPEVAIIRHLLLLEYAIRPENYSSERL